MLLPLVCALALQIPGDEGTLVLREDTAVVGQETFAVVSLAANGTPNGWRVGSRARYGVGSRSVLYGPVVGIGPDTNLVSLEYEVAEPAGPLRILGQTGRGGRFTVRYLTPERERTREFSAGPGVLLLDDSVMALYLPAAWRARPTPTPMPALFARAMRQETLTVADRGVESTQVNRAPATLHHITVTGGAARLVHLWLDPGGRLTKVEIPSRALVAERAPAP